MPHISGCLRILCCSSSLRIMPFIFICIFFTNKLFESEYKHKIRYDDANNCLSYYINPVKSASEVPLMKL